MQNVLKSKDSLRKTNWGFSPKSRKEMQKTRVLYVEDDPTLLAIVTRLLNSQEDLIVVSAANADSALEMATRDVFDVALLDISLGATSISGIELAHRIRKLYPEMGIVFFSQFAENARPKAKVDYFMGWSTISKTGNLDALHIAEVLRATSLGFSLIEENADTANTNFRGSVDALSPKQIQIMGFLSQGFDANKVAGLLNLAPITIRSELTKIYRILVPDPTPGTDLRTTAVLRYLRSNAATVWINDA